MLNPRKLLYFIGVTSLSALLLVAGGLVVSSSVPAAEAAGSQGWLGVQLQGLTDHLRQAMDLDDDARGALVDGVIPGSPADAAGLREGDLIVEVDGHKVTSVDDAVDLVRDREAGDKVLVVVERNGERRGLKAVLGNREEGQAQVRSRVDKDVRRMLEKQRAPEARQDREDQDQNDRPGMAPRWKQDDDQDESYGQGEGNTFRWKQDEDQDESYGRGEGRAFRWKEDDGDRNDNDKDVHIFRFRRDKDHPGRKGMVLEFDHNGKQKRLHIAPPDLRFLGGNGGYLGVETMSLGDQLAGYFQVPDGRGALVTRVIKDTPAAKAGLEAGDVIVAVDGKDVDDSGDLGSRIRNHEPGDSVKIDVIRKGQTRTLNATLGKLHDFGMLAPPAAPLPPDAPLPPGVPVAPEDVHTLHLNLDQLRHVLDDMDLPDIEMKVKGLDRDQMRDLRDALHDLRPELRQNLREHMQEMREQLRESRHAWTDAHRDAEAARLQVQREAERARRMVREAEGRDGNDVTVM